MNDEQPHLGEVLAFLLQVPNPDSSVACCNVSFKFEKIDIKVDIIIVLHRNLAQVLRNNSYTWKHHEA